MLNKTGENERPRVAIVPAAAIMLALVFAAALPAMSSAGQDAAAKITRSEFAASYLRFEKVMLGAKLAAADEARVNREFDGLTLLFFTRQFGEAMRRLNALTDSIDPHAAAVKTPDFATLRKQAEILRPKAAALLAELDAPASETPALVQALAAVKARLRLLARPFDTENTAQFLMDPGALWAQVQAEAAALKKGLDPFKGRAGDYWRVVRNGEREIPLRVYAPAPAGSSAPAALVIAFHGAGGDENMFMDGYGAGLIKRLADKRKFLLVTPLTDAFRGSETGPAFDALLEALGHDYAIDSKRVYVLGHSAGGMLTNRLVELRGGRLAAAACLCGFLGFPDETRAIPRTLVVAGEIDPIANPARLEPLFKKSRAAGYPVEFRLIENFGHTLLVAKVLPDVLDWLLGPSR
jgi:predicted esterase